MATMSGRTQSIFRSPSFLRFYIGQAFSYLGYGLRLIAIPLLVYHLTGSAQDLGVTYALELLPFSVFGLVGGSLADRLDRRRLMIGADLLRVIVLATFALAYATGVLSLWMLYAGIVLEATAAAVFINCQSSSIPYLLGSDRATEAIASLIATEQVATTVLPPIGGALFALVGPLPALLLNALTYAISLGSIASVKTFGPDGGSHAPSLTVIRDDIKLGFTFLLADPALRTLSALGGLFNFFGFMTAAVFIPFLKVDFGATDTIVGYALGIGAIGSVAGSFLAGRVPKTWPLGRMLMLAYAVDGLLFVPVTFTRNLAVAIVFLTLTNACVMFEIAQVVGWRIRITPEDLVGRVSSAARLVALGGTVPGAIIGGVLADRYGARLPIAVSCVGYVVVALSLPLFRAVRDERR